LALAELNLALENLETPPWVKFEIAETPETAVIIEDLLFKGIYYYYALYICSISKKG
jgi:hypothetical protein